MFSYSCLILDFSCSAVLTFCFIMCQVFSLGDRSRLQETEVTVVVVLHDITWLKKTCIPLLFGLNGAFKAVGVTLLPITVFELFIDNSGSRLFMSTKKTSSFLDHMSFPSHLSPLNPVNVLLFLISMLEFSLGKCVKVFPELSLRPCSAAWGPFTGSF